MRFAMTAKTLARQRAQGEDAMNEITAMNIQKVTKYRKGGQDALEKEVKRLEKKAALEDKKKRKTSESDVD